MVPPIDTVCAIQTKRNSSTAAVQIAATGVRNLGLTFETHLEMSGRPPSREKAKIIRDAEVTVAKPHRNWAIRMNRNRSFASQSGMIEVIV